MWRVNNLDLKTRAKNVLSQSYWWSFLASLLFSGIVGFISGNLSGIMSIVSEALNVADSAEIILIGLAVIFGLYLIIIATSFFVSMPLTIGHNTFYMQAACNNIKIENLFFAFKNKYFNVIKTMFFYNLYITLWSFLFIIPGYIKTYEYAMVPYILAENPGISTKRAFEISKKATYGHKMDMFILDLSFIGWFLLGIVCCFVGTIFVQPYYLATKVQLYFDLKAHALANNYATEMDFIQL